VRLVPLAVARRVRRELPLVAEQHDEAALRAEQAIAWSVTLVKQARQIVLRRELARDLEDEREPLLGRARPDRGASCSAPAAAPAGDARP
jgi:hypothetical protein